jgi:hypothetical protein
MDKKLRIAMAVVGLFALAIILQQVVFPFITDFFIDNFGVPGVYLAYTISFAIRIAIIIFLYRAYKSWKRKKDENPDKV